MPTENEQKPAEKPAEQPKAAAKAAPKMLLVRTVYGKMVDLETSQVFTNQISEAQKDTGWLRYQIATGKMVTA